MIDIDSIKNSISITNNDIQIPSIKLDLSNTKIEVQGKLEELTVDKNGTYEPSEGTTGFNKVNVEVSLQPTLEKLEVTENGVYTPSSDIDGYNEVNVNVQPTLEKLTVTENGTYKSEGNIDGYNEVDVNVQPTLEQLSVTENGVYLPSSDGFNKVDVNVQPTLNDIVIEANGVYLPSSDIDGYKQITVEVPIEDKYKDLYKEATSYLIESTKGTFELNDSTWILDDSLSEYKLKNLLFSSDERITGVVLNRITEIGDRCFKFNDNASSKLQYLKSESIKKIGSSAFDYNCKLTDVYLPNLEVIGSNAFYNCTSLQKIDLPKCTTLNAGAFNGCTKLEEIGLEACTKINNYAFQNCKLLSKLILRGDTVATLKSTNAFMGATLILNKTASIYVKDELVENYKVANNWKSFADIIKPISELVE